MARLTSKQAELLSDTFQPRLGRRSDDDQTAVDNGKECRKTPGNERGWRHPRKKLPLQGYGIRYTWERLRRTCRSRRRLNRGELAL
jgi:hypothetical protein